MCSFQYRFSSSNTPRNFKHYDGSMTLLFICNVGKKKPSIFPFAWFVKKCFAYCLHLVTFNKPLINSF